MKKRLLIKLIAWLAPIPLVSNVFAQDLTYQQLSPITITSTTPIESVNAKVNKAFGEYFKNVTDLKWNDLNKKYLVEFIQNDQQNRALFAKNGELIYHISYGKEKHLPSNVRTIIKREYYDYNIIRALKVNQEKRNIWVVLLEDTNNYIYVRMENMELEETQRIQKANK
ncbi:MAG: hypothetical protein H0V30_08365 [Chitinophagaceae bacterium]|jgi:hypothetical protein|nr:hypothetical protein [Chitinophagaceae bacterium]